MSTPAIYDVAIVGLGPTGAVLANLLGVAGLSVLVLEKEAGIHALPRAIHFDGEVMRVFQGIGLRDAVLAIARPGLEGMHFVDAQGETLFVRLWARMAAPTATTSTSRNSRRCCVTVWRVTPVSM